MSPVPQDDKTWNKKLRTFCRENKTWLTDYSLFIALKNIHNGLSWNQWPEPLSLRELPSIETAKSKYSDQISLIEFEQFIFFTQWQELKAYANSKNVYLFGDMPIFVAYDSVDVWAYRDNFLLDEKGKAKFVAGVPPDAFSTTGQRWGNPLYNWKYMQSQNFSWWIQRFTIQINLFDLIRIDHFRGLEACWHIPAEEETAQIGEWIKSLGYELLEALNKNFKSLPLIVEDLGLITKEVSKLRDNFSLPGMNVMQFAFDGNNDNPYLHHNHQKMSVVYTGTHDNDTSLGWYKNLNKTGKLHLHNYLGLNASDELDMPWVFNRMALASVANLAILPMQDILSLDSSHRMNIPGTTKDNWNWRFKWQQLWPSLSNDLKKLNSLYCRSSN
ncbi:MAG: 4-alpha-glucanotransferase [Woeseiaceae bacterium]